MKIPLACVPVRVYGTRMTTTANAAKTMKTQPVPAVLTRPMSACYHENRRYLPIKPQADTDKLAQKGDRLMLYRDREELKIFTAPAGVTHAGWALGIFED